ncbi:MAG: hypothetical protein ACO1TE_09210 [Prosthecobacter sp.]
MREFTPVTKKLLDELLAQEPNRTPAIAAYLACSDDFYDGDRHRRAAKQLPKYEKIFETALSQIITLLGQPIEGDPVEGVPADAWWPEALRLACWDLGDKAGTFACLGLEHQDAELPIMLTFKKLTKDHIRKLGTWD